MVHYQEPVTRSDTPGCYAYCTCGVCGPSRGAKIDAVRDDRAHAAVCSQNAKKEAA